jgi:Protein of unknown function (DUF1579)
MKSRFSVSAIALALAALLASAALAQEKGAASGTASKGKKPSGPPDEKAMMEMMQKAGTPGEAHKKLDAVVGTFDATVKMWMDPSKPPDVSTGVSENKWVLGDRFVEMQYTGTFMGQPFTGIGYQGYDNTTKKYVGTWMDSASTGMMMSTGGMTGNTMTTTAMVADPMTGKMCKITDKVVVTDNDHHMMEMWGPDPTGKNYKMMEITYIRKK